MHVPSQKRTKLDDRSEKHIFIGYDLSSKDYKLYNPVNQKIINSKNFIFEEDKAWDWTEKEKEYTFFPHSGTSQKSQETLESEAPQSPTQSSESSSASEDEPIE